MHSCSDVNCVLYVCVNTFWVEGVSHESTRFQSQKKHKYQNKSNECTYTYFTLTHTMHHVQMHAICTQQYTYTIDANDTCIHTHKHARAHTHKHTHTHAYTLAHARTHAYRHTRTRAHTHAHTLTHSHTHITYTHTHTHTHTHYVQPNTYIHKCTLTHIHTHADT